VRRLDAALAVPFFLSAPPTAIAQNAKLTQTKAASSHRTPKPLASPAGRIYAEQKRETRQVGPPLAGTARRVLCSKGGCPGVFSLSRFRPVLYSGNATTLCSPLAGSLSLECGGLTPLWLCLSLECGGLTPLWLCLSFSPLLQQLSQKCKADAKRKRRQATALQNDSNLLLGKNGTRSWAAHEPVCRHDSRVYNVEAVKNGTGSERKR
jgi:hypothetical protein